MWGCGLCIPIAADDNPSRLPENPVFPNVGCGLCTQKQDNVDDDDKGFFGGSTAHLRLPQNLHWAWARLSLASFQNSVI
jgi:hypothetical protein